MTPFCVAAVELVGSKPITWLCASTQTPAQDTQRRWSIAAFYSKVTVIILEGWPIAEIKAGRGIHRDPLYNTGGQVISSLLGRRHDHRVNDMDDAIGRFNIGGDNVCVVDLDVAIGHRKIYG